MTVGGLVDGGREEREEEVEEGRRAGFLWVRWLCYVRTEPLVVRPGGDKHQGVGGGDVGGLCVTQRRKWSCVKTCEGCLPTPTTLTPPLSPLLRTVQVTAGRCFSRL